MRRECWIGEYPEELGPVAISAVVNKDYLDKYFTPDEKVRHMVELQPSEVILSREVLERTVDAISFIIKELRLDQNGSSWPEVLADLEAALK